MRRWLAVLLFLCLAAFAAGAAFADTLVLKDGRRFKVDDIWEDEGKYECVRFGQVVTYPKVEVMEWIKEGEEGRPAAPSEPAAASGKPGPKPRAGALPPVPRGSLPLANKASSGEMSAALAKKYDPNQVDVDGNTAAHTYAMEPDVNSSSFHISALARAGADLGIINNKGETPLMTAFNHMRQRGDDAPPSSTRIDAPSMRECRPVIDNLIKYTPDLNYPDQEGNTPLIAACRMDTGKGVYDYYMLVEELVVKGVDLNASNNQGNTALHIATKNCSTDIIRILAMKGADPNIKDRYGRTAFDLAADCGGDADDITKMLERGPY